MDVLGSLRAVIKTDETSIDNNVFRLHYKATVILLIAFSLLVTSRQYFGDPISCIQTDDIPSSIINQYCWIHSTFTLPGAFNKSVGKQVPHPGIDKYVEGQDELKYHKYYQWVCFVLFFQAVLFYVPRYLWKTWEGGRLKMLVVDLDCSIIADDARKAKKRLIIDYFYNNMHNHNYYMARFVFCELLNFVNVIFQIFFVDKFLGGEFTTYGADVIRFTETDQEDRADPMVIVFPRITKCTFHKYGPSGDVQKHDALCVLPLNIVNEKIYVFLWFWFIFLSVLSGLCLFYRLMVIFLPKTRAMVLKWRARLAPKDYTDIVVRKSQIGDWFLLYLLGKNMEPIVYKEFITDLARKLEGKDTV